MLVAAALLLGMSSVRGESQWTRRIRALGDYLLAQQTPHGCIPDAPGSLRANQDCAMQHALLALVHAFRLTGSNRFRSGLRKGLEWLAATMEKNDRRWVGSWRHAYSTKPPYLALPTAPCPGAEDARGHSATSALFVYLLGLYTEYTGTTSLSKTLRPHARAALDFILKRNLAKNDLFYRGWHRPTGESRWTLCRTQYACDQASVYLGLRAGYWLLGNSRYDRAADDLARRVPDLLFDKRRQVFAVARTEPGELMPPSETRECYFTQGYLAWVFGMKRETNRAMKWLRARHAPDASVRAKKTDLPYTLSAAIFCLGTSRLGLYQTQRRQTKRWLRDLALTPQGGIREFVQPNAPVRNCLNGWVAAAWLGSHPLPFRRGTPGIRHR